MAKGSASANAVPEAVYGPGYTTEIGGSRFALWGQDVISPQGWGQIWAAKPLAFPSVPTMYGMPLAGPTATVNPSPNAAGSLNAPMHPTQGIVPWVILGIIAVGVLHWLHWKEPKRERKEGEAA
jgi:hypothetical protein